MTHIIRDQNEKSISETYVRDEIINAIDMAKSYCYVDGIKIDIVRDYRNSEKNLRETTVHIEGI